MTSLFAQAASDYGAIIGIGSQLERSFASARIWFRTGGPEVWFALAAALLLLILMWRRRR